MRKFKLVTRFYRGIFFANFLITLCCIALLAGYGPEARKAIGMIFWFKVITIGVIFYSALVYKRKEFYYYQNLGVSKVRLGVITSSFDFALWLILIIIVY